MKPFVQPFGDEVITLRLVKEHDLETILAWRNRDEARVWFKTSEKLSFDSHRRWYENYLASRDDFFFIIEADDRPVGQCALYRIDAQNGSAEVGRFLAAPGQSGKGYIARSCAQLVNFGTQKLFLEHLYLEVMEGNVRAIDIYRRCGFIGERRSGGMIRMTLTHTVLSQNKDRRRGI